MIIIKNLIKVIIINLLVLFAIVLTIIIVVNPSIKQTFSKSNNTEYIYLDPGHGGKDVGGVSKTNIYEKNVNLNICFYLKGYLENSGYNVKMTRYADHDLASQNSKNRKHEDMIKRVNLINDHTTILFISLHCNIYTDSTIKGAQTFYKKDNEESKQLSESIQEKMKILLKNTDRKAKSITSKYIIDNTTKVGSLVEVGFLSNDLESKLLSTKEYQDLVAYAIYIGIIEYLGCTNKI